MRKMCVWVMPASRAMTSVEAPWSPWFATPRAAISNT